MYGFVQTLILWTRPADFRRWIWVAAEGKVEGSQMKSHQWKGRSQKQSKWKTSTGIWEDFIFETKWWTVDSE